MAKYLCRATAGAFGENELKGDCGDYGFEQSLLASGLGEGQSIDLGTCPAYIYLELLHEGASERFSLPVLEVAAEYALENTVEVVGYFLRIESEDEHEYGELLGGVV